MAYEDFGGPRGLDPEARRIAYMLNTGNPNAEHEAAMELSQDLFRLPVNAQIDLVRRAQMYEAPGVGGKIDVEQISVTGPNGFPVPTGDRAVRVVDAATGVNDGVTTMTGTYAAYRPGAGVDLFFGVTGCTFAATPWLDAGWRQRELVQRQIWMGHQSEWGMYDGRLYGRPGFVRPALGFDIGIGNLNIAVGIPFGHERVLPGAVFAPPHRETEWERLERLKHERERWLREHHP